MFLVYYFMSNVWKNLDMNKIHGLIKSIHKHFKTFLTFSITFIAFILPLLYFFFVKMTIKWIEMNTIIINLCIGIYWLVTHPEVYRSMIIKIHLKNWRFIPIHTMVEYIWGPNFYPTQFLWLEKLKLFEYKINHSPGLEKV